MIINNMDLKTSLIFFCILLIIGTLIMVIEKDY
jgi:hypothetical protein